jgi:hypothetical protein
MDVAPVPGSGAANSIPLATVLVAVIMLGIGVLRGYFGRPLVEPQPVEATAVAAADTGDPSAANGADGPASNPSAATLMAAVIDQTRHFKGDPGAPVTIVEFGDFQ